MDLIDRAERDCGLELRRGVGGCSSRSFWLVSTEGGFSDAEETVVRPLRWLGAGEAAALGLFDLK